jgi:predicted lipoprotein with Yx(FWY)xxD motif
VKRLVLLVALVVVVGQVGAAHAKRASTRAIVKVAYNKQLKTKILVDGRGRTLYYVNSEQGLTTGCVDDCAKSWPPLLTSGSPKAGPGARQSLLVAAKRPEGTMQVAYHGHLLYTWAGGSGQGPGDGRPGDILGQGRLGVWWVLSPAGKPILKQP